MLYQEHFRPPSARASPYLIVVKLNLTVEDGRERERERDR